MLWGLPQWGDWQDKRRRFWIGRHARRTKSHVVAAELMVEILRDNQLPAVWTWTFAGR